MVVLCGTGSKSYVGFVSCYMELCAIVHALTPLNTVTLVRKATLITQEC